MKKNLAQPKPTTLDSILENSAKLFFKKGFDLVSFAQIAKEVGVSQPALYSHVENKMDLIRQVFLYSAKIGRNYIDSFLDIQKNSIENLLLYIEGNMNFFYHKKVHAHSILALYYFSASHPEFRELYYLTQETAIQRITQFLIQARHEGKIPAGSEAELAAEIHTLLVGMCYRSIYARKKEEHEKFISLAKVMIVRCIAAATKQLLK